MVSLQISESEEENTHEVKNMTQKILAIDDDPFHLNLVTQIMERQGFEMKTASDGVEALELIEKSEFDLIISDVMMPNMDGYTLCRQIRENPKTSQTPILLLTALDTIEEKIRGFEAGADDHIPKPYDAQELLARVQVQLRRVEQAPIEAPPVGKEGKVIAVYSMRGGVGVTTVATNLTAGISQLWNKPTALVDLVLMGGQSALTMNLPLRNTWANLGEVPIEDIDTQLMQILLLSHESRARVLAAPYSPEQGELISAEKVSHVLALLKSLHDYVIIDLPHDFSETTLAGLDATDELLVLLAPELASVRSTSLTLETLYSLNFSSENIHLVLNWTFERLGLSRTDINTALKKDIEIIIPFAPEAIVTAINVGVPTVFAEPETPLGALFEDLSFKFSKQEHKEDPPKLPTEVWERVTERGRKRKAKGNLALQLSSRESG
jgi:pilus assembly protein CpaE